MGDCNQNLGGCSVTHALNEELVKQREDSKVYSERLRIAAEKSETQVQEFTKCLEAIEKHTAAISKHNEMLGIGTVEIRQNAKDINNLATLMRDHSLDLDNNPMSHKDVEREFNLHCKWLWGLTGATGLIVLFLIGTHYSFVTALLKHFGLA